MQNAIHKDVVYDDNYRIIKVVRNPYTHAVNKLRIAYSYGLDSSFYELMKNSKKLRSLQTTISSQRGNVHRLLFQNRESRHYLNRERHNCPTKFQ